MYLQSSDPLLILHLLPLLLNLQLWKGVQQVVAVVGAKAGPLPGGGFGYIDGLTPEVVEAGGESCLGRTHERMYTGLAHLLSFVFPRWQASPFHHPKCKRSD